MNLLLYFILLAIATSFWLIGYIYLKRQNYLLAYENEVAILRAKTKHKLEVLEQQKQELLNQLEEIKKQLQKLEET